jgi:hypothetical protein
MKLHQQTLKDFKVSIGCIDSSPLLAIAWHCLAAVALIWAWIAMTTQP